MPFFECMQYKQYSVLSACHSVNNHCAILFQEYGIYLRTWGGCNTCTVFQLNIGAVAPCCCMNLWTKTTGFCQTPFTTWYPGTIIFIVKCVDRLTHDWFNFESRLKCSTYCNSSSNNINVNVKKKKKTEYQTSTEI